MAGINPTSVVYRSVIDDVVTRVKPEFVQQGVNESVLDELRALWESKLLQSGAIDNPPQRPAPLPMSYQTGGYLPRPGVQHQAYAPGTATTGGYRAGPIQYDAQLAKQEQPLGYTGIQQRGQVPFYSGAPTALGQPPALGASTPVYHPQQQHISTGAATAPVYRPQPVGSVGAPAPSYRPQGVTNGAAPQSYRPQPTTQPQTQKPQLQQQPALGAPAPVYRPQTRPAAAPSPISGAAPAPVYRPQPTSTAGDTLGAPSLVYRPPGQQQPEPQSSQPAAPMRAPLQSQQQSGGTLQAAPPPVYRPQPAADAAQTQTQTQSHAGGLSSAPAPVYRQQSSPAGVKRPASGELQAPSPQRQHTSSGGTIPQQDGGADDEEADGDGEPQADGDEDDDEGEDLAGLSSDEDEDMQIEDVILAQFTKVQRSKNRWKCTLKSGVMHINGRDVLLKSCQGEMNF